MNTTRSVRGAGIIALVNIFGFACDVGSGPRGVEPAVDDREEWASSGFETPYPDAGGACPLPELPGECCLPSCDSSVSARGTPYPGDETTFDCPVAGMPYNCGLDGCGLFDCDDFAYACQMWGLNQGYNICQLDIWFTPVGGGSGSGHGVNIVEFDYDVGDLQRYCIIEPQDNTSYACWVQPPGPPNPPSHATNAVCAAFGGTCTSNQVRCEPQHSPNAGEVCFNTLPAVCSYFRDHTNVCPYTFEEYDCNSNHPDGRGCHWNCADDESCGTTCDSCVPTPFDTPDTTWCSNIDGDNTNCFWECEADQSCGSACWLCV